MTMKHKGVEVRSNSHVLEYHTCGVSLARFGVIM